MFLWVTFCRRRGYENILRIFVGMKIFLPNFNVFMVHVHGMRQTYQSPPKYMVVLLDHNSLFTRWCSVRYVLGVPVLSIYQIKYGLLYAVLWFWEHAQIDHIWLTYFRHKTTMGINLETHQKIQLVKVFVVIHARSRIQSYSYSDSHTNGML